MRSFVESSDLLFGQYGQNDTVGVGFFGDPIFEEMTQKSEWSCESKYEFMLNAASDRLDDILAEGKWKKPGATGADACWVGMLCSIDSFNAYGYVTTNANYLAIVEDGIAPDNVQLQKSRDNELKMLLVSRFLSILLVLSVDNSTSPHKSADTLFVPRVTCIKFIQSLSSIRSQT